VLAEQRTGAAGRELAAAHSELAALKKASAGSAAAGEQAGKRSQALETQLAVASQRVVIAEDEAQLREVELAELREFRKRVQVGWAGGRGGGSGIGRV
jgi:hypothetical protein